MIIIVDGNNLAHIANHTYAMLTHEGQRTELIFVGLNMMRSYLEMFSPARCAVVWDGGHDVRRTAIYPDYKRRKVERTTVEEKERTIFFDQMNRLKDCFHNLGLTQYRAKYREADDVIYNLIHQISKVTDEEIVVVSTDQDFYQLFIDFKNVLIYNPIKKKKIMVADVEKELEINIKDFIWYKSLVGDSSDNLPGVLGIGPKRALEVLEVLHGGDMISSVVETFTSQEEGFWLMVDLVSFLKINKEEIAEAKQKLEPFSIPQLQENAMSFLTKYGLQRLLDNFQSFIQPFEELCRKEISK